MPLRDRFGLIVFLLGAACVARQSPTRLDVSPSVVAADQVATPSPTQPSVVAEPTVDPEPKARKRPPGPPPLRYGPVPEGHRLLVPVSQARPRLLEHGWLQHPDRPLVLIEDVDCLAVDIRTGVIVARRPGEPFGACDLWRSNAEAPGTEHSSADQLRAVEPPDSPYTTALTISDHAGQRLHTIEADGAQLVAHRFAQPVINSPWSPGTRWARCG